MKSMIANRFASSRNALSLNTEALAKYNDIIDLSIGDTDFITDKRIIDAAYRDALSGYTHYGDPKGDPELISAIQKAWQEDFGQVIDTDCLVVTASSCMGMALVMLAMLNPGDEVIVFGPYFSMYKQQIGLAGGVTVEVATDEKNGYKLDESALRNAITPRTKAIILNNPCNPTGAAYTKEELTMLARVAEEYDLYVAADEIYTRYVYEGAFTPLRTLLGMAERTITLNSFSKNFMMTGWRVGYIIAPSAFIRTVIDINEGMVYSTPAISQRAAIKALELRETIQREYISKYKERTFYAADRVEKIPYLTLLRPKGTFYLFPGIEKTGLTDKAFCAKLLEEAHILVSPGCAFGETGKNHFRIACTVGMDKMKEAFDRMDQLHF